ncbi:MAG: DnaJ domain-containing protein [Burkholderiales bacterium]
MSSHYDTLQVSPNASDAVIKAAYRTLAHAYHPDTHPDNAEADALMKQINTAYQILSDRRSRLQYEIQHGLHAVPHSASNVVDQVAPEAAGPDDMGTQPNADASFHSTFESQPGYSTPKRRPNPQPLGWAIRLVFFAGAAIFSVMATAKWIIVSDSALSADSRSSVPAVKLRLDKQPLFISHS